MRFAVGDVHGFRQELTEALQACDLVDARGDWSGGVAEVWFAGDLMDRGPDGVGVVSDLMRWQRQAADTGGYVGSVLGNHDVLALAVRKFHQQEVPGGTRLGTPRSFALSWIVNGGQTRDQRLLTDEMVEWMSDLPAVVVVGSDLLLHADTMEYLGWGGDAAAVSSAVSAVLHGDDIVAWWQVWSRMTTRYAFIGDDGPDQARRLLDQLGGDRIVHGHSIIGDLRNIDSTTVEGEWSYAEGLVLAVDGGRYDGGPVIVAALD